MTILSQDTIKRALKTVGEVAAAVAAAGAALPKAPGVGTGAVIVGGSGVAALVVNAVIDWFTNAKNAKLDKLAAAIDSIVDARLAKQGVADVPPAAIPEVPAV